MHREIIVNFCCERNCGRKEEEEEENHSKLKFKFHY